MMFLALQSQRSAASEIETTFNVCDRVDGLWPLRATRLTVYEDGMVSAAVSRPLVLSQYGLRAPLITRGMSVCDTNRVRSTQVADRCRSPRNCALQGRLSREEKTKPTRIHRSTNSV